MKSERKLKELKTAAWDAIIAEEAALAYRELVWLPCKHNSDNGISPTDSDWEAYRAADKVFMDARAACRLAANTANAYETEDK